jgi:hypothetical protein
MKLINLNKASNNKDDFVVMKYAMKALEKFKDDLIGVELGSCYGGNVEEIATAWKGHGKFYGYDTFEGHPKQLADNPKDFEAICMDYWYKEDVFGREHLAYDYQRGVLDELGLDNAFLVKGLVNEHSCDQLEHINFAFLDMDLHVSMANGFKAVKDKIVKGGYLLLHDVVDKDHIPLTHQWYLDNVKTDPNYKMLSDNEGHFIAVYEKL